MDIGDSPPSPAEEILRHTQIQVAISKRLTIHTEWRYDLRSPFWRIYVNSRSGAAIFHEGKKISLHPGRVYLLPAWVRFQTLSERPVTQDFLHFYVTGLPASLLRRLFDHPLLLPHSDKALQALVRRWQKGLSQDREPGFAELIWAGALAHAAAALAMESLSSNDQAACLRSLTGSGPIGPALAAIDRSLSHPPANPALAHLCGLSTDHFIRQFRHLVGMTPAQYGIERRVAIAARWLTTGERAIDDIAAACGFTDRFHFSRAFKARLGTPPAAYRAMHRRAIGKEGAG